ncbi:MAG: hypothetical protein KZQ95_07190 [Candidatus Thiodiazotropha sp. (ex Epidulcina cf. delphinae)]|nr:hypothetical protein [Candidatus Thiodiazotropha sp. (ex Epidulcina cf. delphinae)]
MNGMNFLWSPQGVSLEALDRHYRDILLSFYRRPSISIHYVKLSIYHPRHFIRLMKFAFDYLLCRVRRHAPEPLGSQKQRDSEL